MTRAAAIEALGELQHHLGMVAAGTQWYLFGSVDRDERAASDIDLMILCEDDAQADAIRLTIDAEMLPLSLDLALMTYAEAAEVDAVAKQRARRILISSAHERAGGGDVDLG